MQVSGHCGPGGTSDRKTRGRCLKSVTFLQLGDQQNAKDCWYCSGQSPNMAISPIPLTMAHDRKVADC